MAGHRYGVLDHKVHIAIKPPSRIPSRIGGLACGTVHCQHIERVVLNQPADVGLKAKITIVRTAHLSSSEVSVAVQHDTFEVKDDTLALPIATGGKSLAIPSRGHILEPARAARLLVPRHLYLEVVWQVKAAPGRIVVSSGL